MPKAERLPSGNYRARVFIGLDENGKRITKSFTAKTRKEAEYLASDYLINLRKAPADYTVQEAIEKYIETKNNVLSPSTISGYKKILRNNMQNLMGIKLKKLDNVIIQAELNRESAHLSPKSLRNAYGLLSSVLDMFYKSFDLEITFPAKVKKIIELPSAEEVIKAVKGTNIELPTMLALWLGLRMSEVRGLRYSDISDGYITIQNTIIYVDGENVERNTTKTSDSTRKLRLPDYLINLIDTLGSKDSDYIIQDSGQAIYKRFKRQMERHNINMRFHDLRHLNASLMVKLGIPDLYAMERGGWSSNQTLKKVYQHTFTDERKAVDDIIDYHFTQLLGQ